MTNTRNIINLVLLVFIIIAASIVRLDTGDENKKSAITSLLQNDVLNITVRRAGKKDIYLEKNHTKWRIKRPYNAATNQFRMDTLLRLVQTIPQSTYPLKNIAQYGLAEPKLVVEFNNGLANAVSIKFGDSDPIKMRRYVAVNDKLYLTNDTYFYALNSIATDYISNKLLPDDFKIIQLDLPELKLKIENDKWKVTPTQKDFSVDLVNELISEWQNAQAMDIKPYELDTGISPSQTIKIYGKDASTLTFYILKDNEEFVFVNKLMGLKYSFPKEKQQQLLSWPKPPVSEEPIPETGTQPPDKTIPTEKNIPAK